MLSGIVPVKLFQEKSNVSRLGRLEKLTLASSPVNLLLLLLLRLTVTRFVHSPKDDGSSPDKLLLFM
uniref:Uncharacterized protein n=1 Tax=Oryza brachyantha TaxID=4533 RepID=J3L9P5_ORYBR